MSDWKTVKISSFLKVRQGKYKPDDEAIANLKRLNKIDFSGRIHLSDKPTKTDMIIVNSGDLVISGINVAKGAIAVHQGFNGVRNNLSSIENYQNRNCKKGEEGTITQI